MVGWLTYQYNERRPPSLQHKKEESGVEGAEAVSHNMEASEANPTFSGL